MNKITLYGHSGSYNHGCEALVRSTVKILKFHDINVPIILGTERKNEDQNMNLDKVVDGWAVLKEVKRYSFIYFKNKILKHIFDSQAILKFKNSEIVENIDESTVAISIGGDNYCYSYPHNLIYLNKTAKNKNAKTVLWGCSLEPTLLEHNEIVADLKRYDLITPRESITYNALLAKGINKNTHLFPDSAFQLDNIKLPLPNGFAENNTVGINMSPLVMKLEKVKNITYKNFANLIDHIIHTTDMQIALIPHVTWAHNNDLKPLTALYEQFKETGRVVLFGDQYNCMELKGFISRCKMFIGARTHATIAAYSTNVPTLVVGYSIKARGIARDIFGSEENMLIPVQSLEHEDDLENAFKYIQENEESIRTHLKNFMPAYIEKACWSGEEVKKIIESR